MFFVENERAGSNFFKSFDQVKNQKGVAPLTSRLCWSHSIKVKGDDYGKKLYRLHENVSRLLLTLIIVMLAVRQAAAQQLRSISNGTSDFWPGDGNASDIQDGNNGTLMNGATFGPV